MLENLIRHPTGTFDVDWQPEILSLIGLLPAKLYYLYCCLKIFMHFRGLVLEYFLMKNYQNCILFYITKSTFLMSRTEGANLDLQIDFAFDDTRHALCECEKCRMCIYTRLFHSWCMPPCLMCVLCKFIG